ncbi:hypothetical protein PoB_006290600 [Plakobranchus ocellatus]|uniref:Uncharacterized protein n=1 Tax=Plakobranchus ocellatus TaxID=259542 RepID=A0AAV4CWY1_9GAST|nr:hypothetical protein PoB_006290600 [Plakobranchus ocellatus]
MSQGFKAREIYLRRAAQMRNKVSHTTPPGRPSHGGRQVQPEVRHAALHGAADSSEGRSHYGGAGDAPRKRQKVFSSGERVSAMSVTLARKACHGIAVFVRKDLRATV